MTEVNSFKNYVLGTFIGHEASTLHNAIIILLGNVMRLALWRPVLHQLLRIQLAPMHLRMGRARRAPSMQTDRLMTSSRGQAFTIRLIRLK